MRCVVVMALLSVSMFAKAQTWDEWFRQKKTQKNYLLQQIAALKVYLDYAEKGYAIAGSGLKTIQAIKQGDLTLHGDHFHALELVNPAIQKGSRVADIILIQTRIAGQAKEGSRFIQQEGRFTQEESSYCDMVFKKLVDQCIQSTDALVSVTTPRQLRMTDDERIKRIEAIYIDMQDAFAFSSSFLNEIKLLAVQRQNDQREMELSRWLAR